MRLIFISLFGVNVLFSLASYPFFPERVASHFIAGGAPNGWMSRQDNLLFSLGLHIFMFLLFYFLPKLIRVFPRSAINIPHKEYWTRDENFPTLLSLMENWMYEFGCAMMLFFLCVAGLVLMANLSDPVELNESIMFFLLGALGIYMIIWVKTLFRITNPTNFSK